MLRRSLPAWLLLVTLLPGAAPPPPAMEVARLVGQLGSETFAERESATRKLEAMGLSVRPLLRQFRHAGDLEVQRRVRELLARLAPRSRTPLVLPGTGSPVYAVALSPDGKRVASGDWRDTVHIYETETGRLIRSCKGHTGLIRRVVFTPDGKHLISGSLDYTVRVWEVATGKEVQKLEGHFDNVLHVALDPTGTRVVSAANDQTVRVWDLTTGKEVACIRDTNRAWVAEWSRDGKQVLSGGGTGDFRVRIHEVATGRLVRTLSGHTSEILGLAVAPDGKTALSASRDGSVRLWDLATGRLVRTFTGHSGQARCVTWSPDGRLAVSGDNTGLAFLWDVAGRRGARQLDGHPDGVNAVAFSADGAYLATGGSDGKVRIWDVADE